MTTYLFYFLILSTTLILDLASCRHFHRDPIHPLQLPDDAPPDPPAQWFNQTLDHFNALSNATWQQKYYSRETARPGPIFIYIGGEGPLSASRITVGMVPEMAEKFNSPIYSLEHRYFGSSFPTPNISTESLQWLSVEQAVWDLNHFIHFIKTDPNRHVVVFGCSYPGVVSATMRSKFSFSNIGSIASSAPIVAKEAFVEYDQMVKQALPPTCANHIQAATQAVQNAALNDTLPASNYSMLLSDFSCSALPNSTEDDVIGFLYVLADVVAYSVQYNSNPTRPFIDTMCGQYFDTLPANPTDEEYIQMYSDYVKFMFTNRSLPCHTWNIGNLTDISTGPSASLRSWMWMSCEHFGFWQVGYNGSLRSELITVDWHIRYVCDQNFAKSSPWKDDEDIITNQWLGSREMVSESASTNIHFTNGGNDPWSTLSVRSIDRPFYQQVTADIVSGGSHCLDFGASSPTDSQSLKNARQAIEDSILGWITSSCENPCQNGICIAGECFCPKGDNACNQYSGGEPSNWNSNVSPTGIGFIGAACAIAGMGCIFLSYRHQQHRKKSSEIGLAGQGDSSDPYNSY